MYHNRIAIYSGFVPQECLIIEFDTPTSVAYDLSLPHFFATAKSLPAVTDARTKVVQYFVLGTTLFQVLVSSR